MNKVDRFMVQPRAAAHVTDSTIAYAAREHRAGHLTRREAAAVMREAGAFEAEIREALR